MTADVLRSLSLFITYALHRHNPLRTLKIKKSNISLRRPGTRDSTTSNSFKSSIFPSLGQFNEEDCYTRQQLGVKVLEMYHDILCEDANSTANLKRFAKTVTNRWLLYLLAEQDATVVTIGAKLLARLLVVHGPSYVTKFATKSGGFIIMRNRLKRWWSVPQLWPVCFSILFGKDVAALDVDMPLDLFTLLEAFSDGGKAKVMYPEILPVISSMLKAAVSALVSDTADCEPSDGRKEDGLGPPNMSAKSRRRSMSVNDQSLSRGNITDEKMAELSKMIQSIIQFIAHLHSTCPAFRDFCINSGFLREVFGILFPVVCSSDHVSAETELNSRDSALTFDGGDVVIRPLTSNASPPIVRTVTVHDNPSTSRLDRQLRGSSFVLVTQEPAEYGPSAARLAPGIGSGLNVRVASLGGTNILIESLMELIMAVFLDMVFERRDFQTFSLNAKVCEALHWRSTY